ncbi:hypothetical protein B566_EDAN012047 [Ephemera danica]|nr:hypothetical protein B566_EDAN012047 [Ephemera danica]
MTENSCCLISKPKLSFIQNTVRFLNFRANTQEAYAKNLIKLGKLTNTKNEFGMLGRSWQNSHNRTEGLGDVLLKAATSMDQVISHATDVANKQREQRKREEDDIKQVQTALKNAMTKSQTRLKHYLTKKKEKEVAESAAEQAQEGKEANKAEQQLEEARSTWQQRTQLCYQVFEALEEQRMNLLVSVQQTLRQIEADRLVTEEELVTQLLVMTVSDVKEEFTKFVMCHKTNQEPPLPITFTIRESNSVSDDFDDDEDDISLSFQSSNNPCASTPSPPAAVEDKRDSKECKISVSTLPRKLLNLIPMKREKDMMVTGNVIKATPAESCTNPFQDEEEENDVYDFIKTEQAQPPPKPEHDSDISLPEGSLVSLVRQVDEEWVEVKCGSKIGFFPRNYLEPASS